MFLLIAEQPTTTPISSKMTLPSISLPKVVEKRSSKRKEQGREETRRRD